ncbi:succinylglutamate desuccinylase/aspartoacylase family protein [Aquitalea palustris]|uniref:Succinylglutamate desuccinylase/aspartoacylase family protein n=1 Tax=Aquitalea palustris TaxID=2480983 RepID=A0A454JIT5_9NEIS|nr:succinylglutamate desuccinylase/aspartoacylase family protein [Aquitalea palustris]RMC98471.1 succinylglutamate desuccinylase/aspartoacylase family protein [Aquitalea palustris]
MRTEIHPLLSPSLGTQRSITSFHFGSAGTGSWPRKVYIQASLHAGEIPGMLVAHKLRQQFAALEQQGLLQAEIVLVPVANPIGLAQQLHYQPQGRFDLESGENFNRLYSEPSARVLPQLADSLTQDAHANRDIIRQALRAAIAAEPVHTELQSLRQTLHLLAIDADLVLDLHCDFAGPVHIYAHSEHWPLVEALAAHLQCGASLLADAYGVMPFDEAIFLPWAKIRAALPQFPVPFDSVAVTVELRGEGDVSHALADQDSQAILHYLTGCGVIRGETVPAPALPHPATPLDGSETLIAPHAGVIVSLAELGSVVQAGDAIADVIDPITGSTTTLRAGTAGVFYVFARHPYVTRGGTVAKIAGASPLGKGNLLGA